MDVPLSQNCDKFGRAALPETILAIIGAYLLGSVSAAYIVAGLLRGVDIRRYGSGNIGSEHVADSLPAFGPPGGHG
ncbi:glycerol-3-phosphate acyltransferase [Chloroflexota bacterium]